MGTFRIVVLCGGPSGERGISLNSARSVCDHLDAAGSDDEIEIRYLYLRDLDQVFPIQRAQLYSNTPLDFDFKLSATPPLDEAGQRAALADADLVLPVIHGRTGEDGQIQRRLEGWGVPFWGSGAAACELAYPKHGADPVLSREGFFVLPAVLVREANSDDIARLCDEIEAVMGAATGLIVKPRRGGSSLGVHAAETPRAAVDRAFLLLDEGHGEVVVEPALRGREFTVLVLEGRSGEPVALLPTEIELREGAFFSYQRKYLASEQTFFHTPPRFDDATVARIQAQAERLFRALGLRHFARLDGWLLDDGNLYFSDINPISGMEQNSFLFQQTSRLGMSHRDTLRFLVERACQSHGKAPPALGDVSPRGRQPVAVLGGGVTAEREVSILSSTNVWMKLRSSPHNDPAYFLLAGEDEVWSVPYSFCLSHTVSEIADLCRRWPELGPRIERLAAPIRQKLGLGPDDLHAPLFAPEKTTRAAFLRQHGRVFVGLHGGLGEDGRLQAEMDAAGVRYNGSGPEASALCMDKDATGRAINALGEPGLSSLRKRVVPLAEATESEALWGELRRELGASSVIVKPVGDGCSAGVCRLDDAGQLARYVALAASHAPCIPEGHFRPGEPAIRMPEGMESLLFERFLETDRIRVDGGKFAWDDRGGWVEVTVGVVGPRGALRAMTPSITVAEGVVLSLEEKFQGGTGINLTPPPPEYMAPEVVEQVRRRIEKAAEALGIRGYARLDAFVHRQSGEVILIEANTLPGLSPSTVIFHQALAGQPPLFPREFLETLIPTGTTEG